MVGTHVKTYRTFVGNASYVSVPGLIDPRVMYVRITHTVAHAHAHGSRHESKNNVKCKAVFPIQEGKMLPTIT